MRAAKILCAFLLFAACGASAASECEGDSCPTDQDSAALLQSKVELLGSPTGKVDKELLARASRESIAQGSRFGAF